MSPHPNPPPDLPEEGEREAVPVDSWRDDFAVLGGVDFEIAADDKCRGGETEDRGLSRSVREPSHEAPER